jgi:phosphotransferase family enzyme
MPAPLPHPASLGKTGELLARALREFRVTVDGSGNQPDAGSGAGVWAARTASGDAAVLKVTPPGPPAQRELRFYREVAGAAPVRTPALLDAFSDESGVALLLAAAGSPCSPASWTAAMWAELGTALAALHGMPAPPGGAPRDPPPVDHPFWAGRLPELPDRAALLDAMNALPPVFTHGDCHLANLLHGPAGLVFCDWQSSGPGRPGTDLAFPSVRATPAGTVVPPTLLDAYLLARPVDRAVLSRAVIAEELSFFLYLWPPYAPDTSPTGIARVVARTRELAHRWQAIRTGGDAGNR